MKVSYAITVCNEQAEIIKLVELLLDTIRDEDEIVVLYDQTNGNSEIPDWLRKHTDKDNFDFRKGYFKGHFANWKNTLTEYCTGDYIFQIDADEYPDEYLIDTLPYFLKENPETEVFWVPRTNIVDGITPEHIAKWGWVKDNQERINYPDYQCRILQNIPTINWVSKVHEVLYGHKSQTQLPANPEFGLIHHKHISRQEHQNKLYSTL